MPPHDPAEEDAAREGVVRLGEMTDVVVREIGDRCAILPARAALPLAAGSPAAMPLAAMAITLPLLAQVPEPLPTTQAVALWVPVIAILYLLNFAFSATLIVGGWRMRQAKSYGLSLVASALVSSRRMS